MTLDMILIGLAIALHPLPVMALILLLSGDRGLRKGLVFVLAWLACLVVVIACLLLFTGGTPPKKHTAPSTAALAVKLAVGVGLILYGVYKQRGESRPRGEPAWLGKLRNASGWSAAGMAVLLQPWGLVAAGAATVVNADLSHAATWLTLVLYCLLASSTLLAMELYATFRPARATAELQSLLRTITTHQDQAVVLLSLGLGLWLTARSLYELT
ncbi:GAP family protein [Streptomyces sp. CC208A]|uniref:GAP family protein n=1 Tax=Streptomyces sp. CC208A TaxID=3044573 RepID=UPI0024A84B39|nr:GAP family protein [Streptomyces sp. CC208A]